MYKIIQVKRLLILSACILLTSCIDEIEVAVQVMPYACVDGWRWTLSGEPVIDDYGKQLTCEITVN